MFFKRKKIKLVTHDNRFHADDIFATAVLLLVLGKGNVEVVRTRDKDVISSADYVYDVGGIYDEEKNRFDHHQEEMKDKRENGVPYSSFGLVWKKFGDEICGSENVAGFIDRKIVQSIDALDNSTKIYKVNNLGLHPQTLNSVISSFWPTWLEDFNIDQFNQAVDFAQGFISREIRRAVDREKARIIIENIYKKTEDKRVIILDKEYPYEDILNEYDEPLFVVRPCGSRWLIESLRSDPLSFDLRKLFPKKWAGKEDEELQKITDVKSAIFCHKRRFIAAAKLREDAIKIAGLALSS